MIAVFDTNIVIDALSGVPEADHEYGRYERVIISLVTWMEVLVGAQEDEVRVRGFLETKFEIAVVDRAVAEAAVRVRRTYHLRLPDAIIWATAQVNNALLVSRDEKDFNPDWGGIRVPYRV